MSTRVTNTQPRHGMYPSLQKVLRALGSERLLPVGGRSSRRLNSEGLCPELAHSGTSCTWCGGKSMFTLAQGRPPVCGTEPRCCAERPGAGRVFAQRWAYSGLSAKESTVGVAGGWGRQAPTSAGDPPHGGSERTQFHCPLGQGVLLCPTCLPRVLPVCQVCCLPAVPPVCQMSLSARCATCLPGVLPVCQMSHLSARCPCLPGVLPVSQLSCLSTSSPPCLPPSA